MIRATGLHGVSLPAPSSARLLAEIGLAPAGSDEGATTAIPVPAPGQIGPRAVETLALLQRMDRPVSRRDLREDHAMTARQVDGMLQALRVLVNCGLAQITRRFERQRAVSAWSVNPGGRTWQPGPQQVVDDVLILGIVRQIARVRPRTGAKAVFSRDPRGTPATATRARDALRDRGLPVGRFTTMRARLDRLAAAGALDHEIIPGHGGPVHLYWPAGGTDDDNHA